MKENQDNYQKMNNKKKKYTIFYISTLSRAIDNIIKSRESIAVRKSHLLNYHLFFPRLPNSFLNKRITTTCTGGGMILKPETEKTNYKKWLK